MGKRAKSCEVVTASTTGLPSSEPSRASTNGRVVGPRGRGDGHDGPGRHAVGALVVELGQFGRPAGGRPAPGCRGRTLNRAGRGRRRTAMAVTAATAASGQGEGRGGRAVGRGGRTAAMPGAPPGRTRRLARVRRRCRGVEPVPGDPGTEVRLWGSTVRADRWRRPPPRFPGPPGGRARRRGRSRPVPVASTGVNGAAVSWCTPGWSPARRAG